MLGKLAEFTVVYTHYCRNYILKGEQWVLFLVKGPDVLD